MSTPSPTFDRFDSAAAAWPVFATPRRPCSLAAAHSREPLRVAALSLTLALHVAGLLVALGTHPAPVSERLTPAEPLVVVPIVTLAREESPPAPAPPPAIPPELAEPRPEPPAPPRAQPPAALPPPLPAPASLPAAPEPLPAEPPSQAIPRTDVVPVPAPATAVESTSAAAPMRAADAATARREQDDYLRTLKAWLLRHRVYPDEARKDRAQGIVHVHFSIDRQGRLIASEIARGTGAAVLDRAALDVLTRASPMPAFPASMQRDRLTVTLPIEFSLTTR